MDIGKLPPVTAAVAIGPVESAQREHALAISRLFGEQAISAGTARMLCSVAIPAGKAINIFNGVVRLADASLSRPAQGISMQAAAINTKCRFMLGSGYVSGLTGLTANTSVYLGNSGALLFAKPGAGMIQGLGYALSTTELFVTISQP